MPQRHLRDVEGPGRVLASGRVPSGSLAHTLGIFPGEQEVWQAVTEAPESIPTSPTEARRALFNLAVRVARNHRRREAQNAARRSGVAVDDIESDRQHLGVYRLWWMANARALSRLTYSQNQSALIALRSWC